MDRWVGGWVGCASTGCSQSHSLGRAELACSLAAPLTPSPGRGSPAHSPPPSHGPNCPAGAGKGSPLGAASPPLPFPAPHPCLGTSVQAWAASPEPGDPNPPSCLGEVNPTVNLGLVYSPGFPPGRFNFCLRVLTWRDAWAHGAPGTLRASGVHGSPPSPGLRSPPFPPLPIRLHLQGAWAPRRGQPQGWGCSRPSAGLGTQRSPATFSPKGAGPGTAGIAEASWQPPSEAREGTRVGQLVGAGR